MSLFIICLVVALVVFVVVLAVVGLLFDVFIKIDLL